MNSSTSEHFTSIPICNFKIAMILKQPVKRIIFLEGYVTKKCGANGTSWYKLNGREWSNYTNCARDDVSEPFLIFQMKCSS